VRNGDPGSAAHGYVLVDRGLAPTANPNVAAARLTLRLPNLCFTLRLRVSRHQRPVLKQSVYAQAGLCQSYESTCTSRRL